MTADTTDVDIHTRTAAEVFGVDPLLVTQEQRRAAKAANHGLMYGQTAFGLAKSLGIDRDEAARHIKAYFGYYPDVLCRPLAKKGKV